MDTYLTILGSAIVATGTILAALISSRRRGSQNRDAVTDIRGDWLGDWDGKHDLIEVKEQKGREIRGYRYVTDPSGGRASYRFCGYFDGFLGALALTGKKGEDCRVLTIFVALRARNRLEGLRTGMGSDDTIKTTKEYVWIKQK